MAETWIQKAESVENNIINGNHPDAKRLLKGQSREQRFQTISWMKNNISEDMLWKYINICITGKFK